MSITKRINKTLARDCVQTLLKEGEGVQCFETKCNNKIVDILHKFQLHMCKNRMGRLYC